MANCFSETNGTEANTILVKVTSNPGILNNLLNIKTLQYVWVERQKLYLETNCRLGFWWASVTLSTFKPYITCRWSLQAGRRMEQVTWDLCLEENAPSPLSVSCSPCGKSQNHRLDASMSSTSTWWVRIDLTHPRQYLVLYVTLCSLCRTCTIAEFVWISSWSCQSGSIFGSSSSSLLWTPGEGLIEHFSHSKNRFQEVTCIFNLLHVDLILNAYHLQRYQLKYDGLMVTP